MTALKAGGQVLNGDVVLDGEVPAGVHGVSLQGQGVIVSVAVFVLGAVDGDVGGPQGAVVSPGADAFGNEVNLHIGLPVKLVRSDRCG